MPPLDFTPLWKVLQVPVRLASSLMHGLEVQGHKNVPQTGGVLILSNHQSHLDPPYVAVRMLRPCTFLAKSELFTNPGFAWLIRSLGAFPVKQGKSDVGAMKQTIKLLEAGRALLMFPEGARTLDGNLQKLEPGMGLVIRKAKVPVVPVALDGTFRAWQPGTKLPSTGKVRIRFGQPIYDLHQLDARTIMDRVSKEIAELFEQVRMD
jgi:1-acyl-sn-glycerol-3-phosphate acyltransferase